LASSFSRTSSSAGARRDRILLRKRVLCQVLLGLGGFFVKAVANLVSGHFADVYGRKHMLVLGWLVGLPVPFMIAWGPNWGWVVAANALLGINQGFAWSS
jgi:MFS family permease